MSTVFELGPHLGGCTIWTQYVIFIGNPTLFKDKFMGIKYGMLLVKAKARLSKARDIDYSLKLKCDYAISFVSQTLVEVEKMD